jgi:hypothetical protein
MLSKSLIGDLQFLKPRNPPGYSVSKPQVLQSSLIKVDKEEQDSPSLEAEPELLIESHKSPIPYPPIVEDKKYLSVTEIALQLADETKKEGMGM